MKKKNILILIAVALLFTLVGYCIAGLGGDDETSVPSETAEASTEPATQPTETARISVFENGQFTFTAAEFREQFSETLPDGYRFAEAVAANPARLNKLQIAICNQDGEETGISVLLNVKEPNEPFNKIALTAGTDSDTEDFSALTSWFVSIFLPHLSAGESAAWQKECTDLFVSGESGFCDIATKEAVSMMILEEEDIGPQYYIVIAVNAP